MNILHSLVYERSSERGTRSRSSRPVVFLGKGVSEKYAANLQEKTHAEVRFQQPSSGVLKKRCSEITQ